MSAVQTVRKYYRQFLGLGWARILLVLAVLFTLVAIANPLWSTTLDRGGGDYVTSTYGWTSITEVTYEGGAWSSTYIQSYNARAFSANAIANAAGASYIAAVVFLIVLVVMIALFSLEWMQRLPSLALLVLGLVVVVFALVALLYPLFTIPAAAASDLRQSAITGYWGATPVLTATFSWGAALGWWSLLIGAILGIAGGLWPFLQGLRTPAARMAPPPREWQVER